MKVKYLALIVPLLLCSCNNNSNISDEISSDKDSASADESISASFDPSINDLNNIINNQTIYASNINDNFKANIAKVYKITPKVTDDYYIDGIDFKLLNVYDKYGELYQENCFDSSIKLIKNEVYYIKALSNKDAFAEITMFPLNNKVFSPYDINFTNYDNLSIDSVAGDPLKPGTINYTQREGGTYLYSNIPESMPSSVLNTCLMRQNDLTGDCFLTFEHQNHMEPAQSLYMGYRLTNNENHDVYVTITNIGYQFEGSWIGEKSWMDYYGVKYDMPSEFTTNEFEYYGGYYDGKSWFDNFLAYDMNYTPIPIEATTYVLPANSHMYVIGGTSDDSYNNYNVNNTADLFIPSGKCINGNVHFIINNGSVTGDLLVYDDYSKVASENIYIQDYVPVDGVYGGRIGKSPIYGVIDNQTKWEFNDLTSQQYLPASFTNYYADELKESYEPFERIDNITAHKKEYVSKWKTHLSAQLNHDFVGTDLVENYTKSNGKDVILSQYIANGDGVIADHGNWMIEYQDNFTFVNKGDNDRIVRLYLDTTGSTFYIVKDMEDNILKAGATYQIATGGPLPCYEVKIKAHEIYDLSLQYVLPANVYGAMAHYVHLMRVGFED